MFGIQQSSVRLPAEKFSQQQQQQQMPDTKQIVFSSSEEMYAEIRGLNFNAVGPTLSRKVCVPATGTSYFHQYYVSGSASSRIYNSLICSWNRPLRHRYYLHKKRDSVNISNFYLGK
jgi:hypothetical protein